MRHNRINERVLDRIISESIDEAIFTDEFKDKAKRFGKKAGKGAVKAGIGALVTAGLMGACAKGLDNTFKYQDEVNQQAKINGLGNEKDVQQYLRDHDMEDTPSNREQAYEYFDSQRDDYYDNHDMLESYSRRKRSMVNESLMNPKSLLKYIEDNIMKPEDKYKLYKACKHLVSWIDKTYHINDPHSVIQGYM